MYLVHNYLYIGTKVTKDRQGDIIIFNKSCFLHRKCILCKNIIKKLLQIQQILTDKYLNIYIHIHMYILHTLATRNGQGGEERDFFF